MTIVETQQLAQFKATDPKKPYILSEAECKGCANYKNDTDHLNFIVYRDRNSTNLKDN